MLRSRSYKKEKNISFLNQCLSMCIKDSALDARAPMQSRRDPPPSKPLVPAEPVPKPRAAAAAPAAAYPSAEGKENSSPGPAPGPALDAADHTWETVEADDDFVLVDAA